MKRSSLSGLHMFMMLAGMIVSAGHFIFVRIVFLETGRDAWIVLLPSVLLGVLAYLAVYALHQANPGATLIEITMRTYGKWLGRLIALPFLLLFLGVSAITVRGVGDFLPTTMPFTPYLIITAMITLLAGLSVRLGLEVQGRAAELLMPGLVLLGITASVITAKDKHYSYLLPIAQTHWEGYIRGTMHLGGLFAEVVVAGMLFPYVTKKKPSAKSGLLFFAIIAMMFIGPMTGPIAVFDANTAQKFNYPTFEEIRYIEIANFLERLDVIGIVLWTCGAYIKLALFLYASAKAITELIGGNDYRPLSLPLAALVLIFGAEVGSSRASVWTYLREDYPFLCLGAGLLVPWVTLLVSRWRKKGAGARA